MTVAGKLQIKSGQAVAVLHLPRTVTIDLPDGTTRTSEATTADAVVVFVTDRAELREELAEQGVQPVRLTAIDETWSALRLQPV